MAIPDENFAKELELFDNEKYFNFAMGKNILNKNLYQKANVIYNFLLEDDIKNIENLEFLKVSREFVEENIKLSWNKQCSEDKFTQIAEYIKYDEIDNELIEKYDELIFKLKVVLFSCNFELKLKDVYKIFLQKLSKITLDDINSGKITVMGVLETRLINFDAVIICDFGNDEYIPKISTKDKFYTKVKIFIRTSNKV